MTTNPTAELDRRTELVLRAHGLSLPEHLLMCTVGYRVLLSADHLVRHTARAAEGDPRGEFSLAEYRAALHQCVERGWLRILTPAECEAEEERRRSASLPRLHEEPPRPGDVDFTGAGYRLFRRTVAGIFGRAHVEQVDSGWNLDPERRTFQVLARTERMCRRRIRELLADPSPCAGEPVAWIAASPPQPCGPWSPNPYLVLPRGFTSTVPYR